MNAEWQLRDGVGTRMGRSRRCGFGGKPDRWEVTEGELPVDIAISGCFSCLGCMRRLDSCSLLKLGYGEKMWES
jgi:hypothetical protein